jgi:hypothetical protein
MGSALFRHDEPQLIELAFLSIPGGIARARGRHCG